MSAISLKARLRRSRAYESVTGNSLAPFEAVVKKKNKTAADRQFIAQVREWQLANGLRGDPDFVQLGASGQSGRL